MNPRTFVVLVAVAVTVVAGVLLLSTVSATTAAGGSVTCGTAAEPSNTKAKQLSDSADAGNGLNALAGVPYRFPNIYVGYAQACADAISTRQGWGLSLLGIGLVGLLGGGFVRRQPQASAEA
jgi:hypothetical protein